MALQQILARAVGDDVIINDSNVVDFEDSGDKVISHRSPFLVLAKNRAYSFMIKIMFCIMCL